MKIDINNFDITELLAMAHSPIRNYIVPDLTSSLIGETGKNGCVRLFESRRNQQQSITPHSHRFDFQCIVLAGEVTNRVFRKDFDYNSDSNSDLYCESTLNYNGKVGSHKRSAKKEVGRYVYEDTWYGEGECYSMTHKQIHSIKFSKGTKVLFFEGKTRANQSVILEPVVEGEIIPTYKVEDWMFRTGDIK